MREDGPYERPDQLAEALRAWAKGIYPLEAGVELLCRTRWAVQLYESGWVEPLADGMARFTYARPRVGEYLAQAGGYLSGGERRQLTTIGSFLGQLVPHTEAEPVADPYGFQLYESIPGVDESFVRLVGTALFHASGMHERGGYPLPWPGEDW